MQLFPISYPLINKIHLLMFQK